jgi:hypothetical protein
MGGGRGGVNQQEDYESIQNYGRNVSPVSSHAGI